MMQILRALCVLGASLVLGGSCLAEPITYTESILATGTIGGVSYTDKLVTLTAVGDTAQIVHTDTVFYTVPVSMRFEIQGGPSGSFLGASQVFLNLAFPVVDFEPELIDGSSYEGILSTVSSGLKNYDLATSVTATGEGGENGQGYGYHTTDGSLVLFFAHGNSGISTFSATLAPAATPEPESWLLLASGLLGMAAPVFRRRARL